MAVATTIFGLIGSAVSMIIIFILKKHKEKDTLDKTNIYKFIYLRFKPAGVNLWYFNLYST